MKKLFSLLLILLFALSSCSMLTTGFDSTAHTPAQTTTVTEPTETAGAQSETTVHDAHSYTGKLCSHYIDVGQGDSIFIELPDGKCMLIDAGERGYGSVVVSYIKKIGYNKLDYVVVTHAHSDHMGGMSEVLRNFTVGKIYMPKAGNNTSSYEKLLQTISEKGHKIKTAKAGVSILDAEDIKVEIISPVKDYKELNNTSAVIMLTFGNTKFLYMGDAERDAENDITANVECDIVKVGHHGSTTSSSYEFVAKTHAKYAVISVGQGNDYGHPKQQTLNRWKKAGAEIWRTDLCGTVIAESDGNRVYVKAEKKKADTAPADTSAVVLVLNTNTKKIHRKDCEHVQEIQPWNYRETTESVYELIEQGYSPCHTCNPDQ